MSYYSNPTAGAAIGAVDKEIARVEKHAKKLRERRDNGRLRQEELERARKRYVGLFRLVFERELAKPPEPSESSEA